MTKPKLLYLLAGLAIFLTTTGISYLVFALFSPDHFSSPAVIANTSPTPKIKKSKIDPSIPRTEICPLNGALFTKQEKDIWSTRRPLAVMIENSVDARPQSGLSAADIVYEAVAEGGITRFMAIYYCNAALAGNLTIAPVRSARIYFVNLVSEYDALYAHVGGAGNCDDPKVDPRAKALCAIDNFGIKDLDQMGYAGDYKTCHRLANRLDKEVAYEHTMACFLDELYNVAAKLKWTNVDKNGIPWDRNFTPWKFRDVKDKTAGSPAVTISYMFWENNPDFNNSFAVKWTYNSASNSYFRENGGVKSIDLNTDELLEFKNVIVQYTQETFLQDWEKHLLYQVIGTGKAIVFTDGVAIPAVWTKPNRTSRTIYRDSAGKEIKLTPGPIWISILPSTNQVNYQ